MIPAIYNLCEEIVLTALKGAKLQINKSRKNFMIEIFILYLSIPGRINFLQLGRFSKYGEQRFRRQFEKKFDFFSFNKELSKPFIGTRIAIAFDPSFIRKSGKHTPGLGYFWSGCAARSLRGLEIMGICVVDADSRLSFHLEAVQTPPIDTLKDNDLNLYDWYGGVLEKQLDKIKSITSYIVADAFFSNKTFIDHMAKAELHLISRLRDNACLKYLPPNKPTGKRGRPLKYGDKININELDAEQFKEIENSYGTKAWTAIVYSKSLERNILLVVEEFICKNKTSRRLLFSTDTTLNPIDVLDIYHTRFQMEYGFRDAKQFTGLETSQARCADKLYFHFNTALTTTNIAKILQFNDEEKRGLPFSMRDYKTVFYNALLIGRFFDRFAISANSRKNQQYFKELLLFGTMAA